MRTGFGRVVSLQTIYAAQKRDQDAQRSLFEQFQQPVIRTLYGLCQDTELAKDWAQEVFITAFKQLPKLKQAEAFGGWLKQITINYAISQLRKQKLQFNDGIQIDEIATADGQDSVDRLVHLDDIETFLRKLTAQERVLVWLYLVEDYSHDELAAMFQSTTVAIRQRYHRALTKLKQGAQHEI